MKKQKTYLRLTLVLSVLFGIILPLAVGVKDILAVPLIFSSIWFVYVIVLWIRVFFSSEALKARKFILKR
jgi:hypothetical protein